MREESLLVAFLQEELPFGEIAGVLAGVLSQQAPVAHPTLDEIMRIDAWARQAATERVEHLRAGKLACSAH
jgi:1-deoxy-D-xylulose 5-phosphate reductoisomerase